MSESGDRRARVFLTGAGGAASVEVIGSLRATGRYFVIVADASPYAGGYAFADRHYVIPFGASEEFEGAVRRIIEREKPHFVIPLVDEEIPKVHHLVHELADPPRIVGPSESFCDLSLDKWKTYLALRDAELPTAASWLASDAGGCTYPAIIKPRHGRGSRGLAFLADAGDLERYLAQAEEDAEQYVVQERLFGTEYTTSVVVGLDGTFLAVVPKEATIKRGITQVGVTRQVDEIDQLGRAMQAKLRADGPFNVQLILGDDRVPRVIEINPRYSTTVALTIGAGLHEVDAVLRHALGEDPGPLAWKKDFMMIRYTSQLFVSEHDWQPPRA